MFVFCDVTGCCVFSEREADVTEGRLEVHDVVAHREAGEQPHHQQDRAARQWRQEDQDGAHTHHTLQQQDSAGGCRTQEQVRVAFLARDDAIASKC